MTSRESRTSHVNLVNRYFNERAESVRQMALNEYKPAFIKSAQKKLKEQNQEFTFERYDQAITRILKKMGEWQAELEMQRAKVLGEVEEHYSQMQRANEALTTLVRSAAKAEESRKHLLGELEKKGSQIIDFEKLDRQSREILGKIEQARDLLGKEGN